MIEQTPTTEPVKPTFVRPLQPVSAKPAENRLFELLRAVDSATEKLLFHRGVLMLGVVTSFLLVRLVWLSQLGS